VLIYAATLIQSGVPNLDACRAAIAEPLTDDPDLQAAIQAVVEAILR
jgi:nitric oxide reductase NorQ protein